MLKSSENQKLLKDALEDLSGDESPPEIPKQNFGMSEVQSKLSVGSQELSQQGGSKVSLGSTNKVGSREISQQGGSKVSLGSTNKVRHYE